MFSRAKSLYIFGAGGHGHDILAMALASKEWKFEGFFDDSPMKRPLGTAQGNRRHLNFNRLDYCAIGLNWPRQRYDLIKKMKWWSYATIIHPKADIGINPIINSGVVIGANSSLGYESNIGKHTHIGANVAIHRGNIGNFVTVCPGATICGDVLIGDLVTIGAGATISNLVTIGDGAFIGAGAVVVSDVAPSTVVAGVPAKRIKDVHNSM